VLLEKCVKYNIMITYLSISLTIGCTSYPLSDFHLEYIKKHNIMQVCLFGVTIIEI